MAIVRALISIGIIIVSFLVGYLFFYVVSDGTKEQKKNHIEECTSQLINVVIFTWIAKIILNIQMFIKDPLVILAYPSNSHAFYFGIGCVAVTLTYKSMKGKVALFPLVHAFVPIFLAASLTYEFIQIVVKEQAYSFLYFIILAMLVTLYIFIYEKLSARVLIMTMMIGWGIGICFLMIVQPFVTVFGYMITPAALFVFVVISLILVARKKGVEQ